MKVFGRKLLDNHREQHAVDFDDIVFEVDGVEITISVYLARMDGRVEIRTNEGALVILPRAANSVEAEVRSRFPVSSPGEPHEA